MRRTVFPALIGNEHLKSILGADILAGKLGHAYILEGPEGSGRHTAALAAAAALCCLSRSDEQAPLPCGRCIVCRKIAQGISPDVLFVRRPDGKMSIGVDAIREMREDLCIAPNENERKVYILENAETMTVQAQNALLLSLEEPPPYVTFFLLTENASGLLETIRSRAPVLRMQLFDAERLASLLRDASRSLPPSDPQQFSEAVTASGGALGAALRMLDRSGTAGAEIRELHAMASQFVLRLFQPDAGAAAALLLELPKARDEVLAMLQLMILALRDLTAVKTGAEVPLTFYLSREECRSAAERSSIARISAAYTDTISAIGDIQANGTVQSACTALLLKKR